MKPEPPILSFSSPEEWHTYLSTHWTDTVGVRLRLAKKDSGVKSISHQEALEIALMFGWIDGKAQTIDETYWLLKFTPRRIRSNWSKRNCEIVERLIKERKMHRSGIKEVEEAKKDGRWEAAYDSPKNMAIPEDFLQELAKNKEASAFFQLLNKTNLYAIGFSLQTAKKEETRLRRMNKIIALLASGKKLV